MPRSSSAKSASKKPQGGKESGVRDLTEAEARAIAGGGEDATSEDATTDAISVNRRAHGSGKY